MLQGAPPRRCRYRWGVAGRALPEVRFRGGLV